MEETPSLGAGCCVVSRCLGEEADDHWSGAHGLAAGQGVKPDCESSLRKSDESESCCMILKSSATYLVQVTNIML